jgi:hypothetical protein
MNKGRFPGKAVTAVEPDAAARTLVIWRRRPDQRSRFRSHIPAAMLARLQRLLSGY